MVCFYGQSDCGSYITQDLNRKPLGPIGLDRIKGFRLFSVIKYSKIQAILVWVGYGKFIASLNRVDDQNIVTTSG